MFTVDKFLGFELESGGQILGGLGIACNVTSLVIFLLTISLVTWITCRDILNFMDELNHPLKYEDCVTVQGGIIITLAILIVICILGTIFSIILLKGIKSRNPCQLLPVMICLVIDIIVVLVVLPFIFSVGNFIKLIILEIIMIYFLIVLYSLYVKFSNEKKGRYNTQYEHP